MTQNEKTKTINAKLATRHWTEYRFDEAFAFACKADSNDPVMMRIMGYGYLYGNGTAVDEEKGRGLLESAMEKGDVEAKAEVARLYKEGYAGCPQDYDHAEMLFKEAVDEGCAYAAWNLGCMCRDGLSTGEADYAKAVEWFKIGANGGDIDSIRSLADCYYNGAGVDRNLKEAFALYKKAAEQSHNVDKSALNMQGWMCEHGEGTDVDVECALDCYQKAAELGNEQAAINLDNLKKGLGDTYKVLEDARAGDMQAQFDLGYSYYNGQNGLPVDYEKSRMWYEQASKLGHANAMFNLGWRLWLGEGGEVDRKRAIELWRRSADKGYLESLNALGRAYQDDEFRDYDKALQCLRESADKGLIWSMNDLGNIYQEGVVVEQDSRIAYGWYLKSAMAGDAAAQWAVAHMNEMGEGVPVNLEESEKWYLLASEQGHADSREAYLRIRRRRMLEGANEPNTPVEKKRASAETLKENVRLTKEALAKNDYITAFRYASKADSEDPDVQFVMGRCFHYGWGVDKNGEEAVNWLSKAADAGNPDAQAELAAIYHDGDCVGQDYAKAYGLYVQSASKDCVDGIIGLGNVLVMGEGIAKDEKRAIELFKKAASMGSLECMLHLGRAYRDGAIVLKDIGLSCKYYKMAADKGDVSAHEQLGELYSRNEYGILNYEEAIRHFSYAAEQGNAVACFYLGVMYNKGRGVERDMSKAIEWYIKAAEQGNATAQFNLGVIYHNGDGCVHDEAESIKWYTMAAKAGDKKAEAILKKKSYSNELFMADKLGEMPYKVFISYRRRGGREYARTLYLELRNRGIKTFFDYTSLQHGDFNADILRAIEEAPNFIMIVTDGAFERCSDENDWVRKEIEYAKKLGKNIVPVAPTGHQQDLSLLPDNLSDVRRRQVFRLDMENLFEESVGKIVKECLKNV